MVLAIYITHRLICAQTRSFRVLSSVLISNFHIRLQCMNVFLTKVHISGQNIRFTILGRVRGPLCESNVICFML